jgi:CubicO group peptidase (beta-lactamase class C family)
MRGSAAALSVPSATSLVAIVLALVLALSSPAAAQCTYPTPVTPETCEDAKLYNGQTGGVSLLVWVDGQVVCEDYATGSGPDVAHELWSCTKSFCGAIAAAAIQDGLISSWDELLVDTIPEWTEDQWKSQVTLRQLISLTSGIKAEMDGGGTPTYAESILEPAIYEPGTVWEYGSVPYQIFGELMRRKLDPTYVDPLAYFEDRVLDEIGAVYDGWTRGSDDMPHLPWGSQWVPRQWINYGELVRLGGYWPPTGTQVIEQELLDEAYHRSPVKEDYGLTWWLPTPGTVAKPCDAVMAFGLGTQKLYVIRSLKLVAVRQTLSSPQTLFFDDDVFLDRLLDSPNPQDDCPPASASGLVVDRADDDVLFDWDPVNFDATGNNELVGGYDLFEATLADFSDATPLASTVGPTTGAIATGAALPGGPDLTFYKVRARDKCDNVGVW